MEAPDLSPTAVATGLARLRASRPTLAALLSHEADADLSGHLAPLDRGVPDRIEPAIADGRPLATFVLGSGRGLVVQAILNGMRAAEVDGMVVLVEPDPRRLLATLVADDWTSALENPGVRFAVGENVREAVNEAVPEHRSALIEIGLRPGAGLIPGDVDDHAVRIRSMLLESAKAEMAEVSARCRAQAASRSRDTSTPSLPDGRWRVLSVVNAHTTALRHLGPSIVDAARRAGHDGTTHLLHEDGAPFTESCATLVSLESNADLVVGFLAPGTSAIPWRSDYPSLVVVSSNPNLLPVETYAWSERDLIVVTEPDFATPYRELGLEPLIHPLGTVIHPLEEIEALVDAQEPCDVLVVGSIGRPEGLSDVETSETDTPLGELADRWIRDPSMSIEDVTGEVADPNASPIWNRSRLALAYEATRRRRVAAVIALAEAGFTVRVHGDDAWRSELRGSAAEGCERGWLPEGARQAACFRAAGVVVNVNSFAAPGSLNMRSFAVPAAGGILVSDDRPALRAAFDVGDEVLAFDLIEELPGLVGAVLEDRPRRDAISRNGRVRAERDHSWDAWWVWAEANLRATFPAE